MRARQGGNRIGCLDVGKCREVDRHRRVDAMTLTRAGVTAVVGAHGSVATRRGVFDYACRVIRRRLNALLGVVGRVCGAIQLCRCRSYRCRRHRHRRSHCLGDLQLQPEHQLKRQQHKQYGPEANSFGDLTTSHGVELTPEMQERDATQDCVEAQLRRSQQRDRRNKAYRRPLGRPPPARCR